MLRTYGPLAAAGGIAAYAGGAFDPVPVEEVSQGDLEQDYVKKVSYVKRRQPNPNFMQANPDQVQNSPHKSLSDFQLTLLVKLEFLLVCFLQIKVAT